MMAAVLPLLYGLAVAQAVPTLLSRLTACGIGVRLGLAAWLVAMTSVVASAVAATWFLIQASRGGAARVASVLDGLPAGMCTSEACRAVVLHVYLCSLATVVLVALGVVVWQYARTLERWRRRTRTHAAMARMTGRRVADLGAVVLEARQLAAYCVPGRPPTIVVTNAAVALLEPVQLAAVLAHERAHLAGRHALLVGLTRGLATLFPAVPVFGRGAEQVALLAEMRADDAAVRRTGPEALVTALMAMGSATAVPAAALGASGPGVLARVRRLLEPPSRACRVRCQLSLVMLALGLVAGWCLVLAYAADLPASGIAN